MGVDLRGFHILVAKQFLNGTDIVAGLKQMAPMGFSQAVAEDMRRDMLGDVGLK